MKPFRSLRRLRPFRPDERIHFKVTLDDHIGLPIGFRFDQIDRKYFMRDEDGTTFLVLDDGVTTIESGTRVHHEVGRLLIAFCNEQGTQRK